MLAAGNKCWDGFVKKWLFQNQPQEVASFMLPVQPPLETAPQFATTHALQVGTVQSPLGNGSWDNTYTSDPSNKGKRLSRKPSTLVRCA
jgi:hypothetical protein